MGLSLTSKAFKEGAPIPVVYTCDGADRSPPLSWKGVPADAGALVLISDDPDAPGRTWVHWVLYDVPASLDGLPENVSKVAVQGKNDFHKLGYGGPCPPPGPAHRYFFKLYALAAPLGLEPGASKGDIEQAISGRVLASAQLMGTYARSKR